MGEVVEIGFETGGFSTMLANAGINGADVGEVYGCGCCRKFEFEFEFGLGWGGMDEVGMAGTRGFVKFKFDDAKFAGKKLEMKRFGVGS
ncbi:hypothetical protein U1Q18_016432 [Sarracenia purpurea var. burkii]